jgi:hypothetical protein
VVVLQQGEAALARGAQAAQPNGTPQLGEGSSSSSPASFRQSELFTRCQYLVGRGPAGLCDAHALRRGEMGRDRIDKIAIDRTRTGQHRVNAILLGLVAGDRQRRVLEAKAQQRGISYAEMERTAFSYTSIKDYVTSEQIADQILFMCSLRGKTISGQAISICGDTQMFSCGTSRWASGY